MTLLDMQRVFSRILTEKNFRNEFMRGAPVPPVGYDLTCFELDSLRDFRWDRVGLHSALLAHGRLELALKALPLTSLLLHSQLHEHLDRFCAEYPPVPMEASLLYAEATRLCDFAGTLLGEGALRPPWAADIIAWERAVLSLTVSVAAASSAIEVAELKVSLPRPLAELTQLIAVAGSHIQTLSSAYPLPSLLATLQEGAVPTEVRPLPVPVRILCRKRPRGTVETIKINEATAALIEACDGERTVGEITDVLVSRFGPGIETRVAPAIEQLNERDLIGLKGRL